MDSSYRAEMLTQVNPGVLDHSQLANLTREYSLNDIAIITRAGPARILGLKNKGHLGVGADADHLRLHPRRELRNNVYVTMDGDQSRNKRLLKTPKSDKPSAAKP